MPKLKTALPSRYYLGVDPGKKGGIAVLEDSGRVFDVLKMPDTKKDLWEAVQEVISTVYPHTPLSALVEKVHSMPDQGVASSFTFGRGYGWLEMAFTAASIPMEDVTPNAWQRGMKIPPRKDKSKTEHKNLLKEKAQGLFPDVKVTLGVADALLIAEFHRRRCLGIL